MTDVWRYCRPLTKRTIDSKFSSNIQDEVEKNNGDESEENNEDYGDINSNSEYTYSGTESDDEDEEPVQRSKMNIVLKKN